MSRPIGILLLQLGTPAAPTPSALRRYLRQFLSDRRVIDLPRALWWPILHGIVLRTRPRRSAKDYAKVWTSEGSPLAVTSAQQARLLQERLTGRGIHALVKVVMRYGEPSTTQVLTELADAGVERIIALPMYPQYASATTGSSVEALFQIAGKRRVVPAIRTLPPYCADAAYIAALAAVTRGQLGDWVPNHVVLSFHGIPERYVRNGDPYAGHCRATARALTEAMAWDPARVTMSFQSRFGPEAWLQPYTTDTLRQLGEARMTGVAVLCPGFTADCLETLEEIGVRERRTFVRAGGSDFRLIPCLNADSAWVDALEGMVLREAQGWLPPTL